jgi:hypothetical protein
MTISRSVTRYTKKQSLDLLVAAGLGIVPAGDSEHAWALRRIVLGRILHIATISNQLATMSAGTGDGLLGYFA